MYEASGIEACKEFVMTHLTGIEGTAAGLPMQDYLAYFFALEQTGNEEYRQKIESAVNSKEWTVDLMPFVTAYETKYKRKEHYNQITAMFRNKESFTGTDLIALIETINQMSEEIYEYYRELKDLFKVIVKEKIKNLTDSSEILEIGYSVLKACNIDVLQKEKYSNFGESAWQTIAGNDNKMGNGLEDMIRAQYTILKKQEV